MTLADGMARAQLDRAVEGFSRRARPPRSRSGRRGGPLTRRLKIVPGTRCLCAVVDDPAWAPDEGLPKRWGELHLVGRAGGCVSAECPWSEVSNFRHLARPESARERRWSGSGGAVYGGSGGPGCRVCLLRQALEPECEQGAAIPAVVAEGPEVAHCGQHASSTWWQTHPRSPPQGWV